MSAFSAYKPTVGLFDYPVKVAGLCDELDARFPGASSGWASPGAIGTGTKNSGAFTTLSATGNVTLGDASGDTLTIAPNAVAWSNNPTHTGDHTFSGTVRTGALTVTGTSSVTRSSGNDFAAFVTHSHAVTPWGIQIDFPGGTPNGTSNYFVGGHDSSAWRFFFPANGGLHNFSANNVNLSDERLKPHLEFLQDVPGMKDAAWNGHRRVAWNRHKFHDQAHDDWNYGYGARQVVDDAFGGSDIAQSLRADWHSGLAIFRAVHETDLRNLSGFVLTLAQERIERIEQHLGL